MTFRVLSSSLRPCDPSYRLPFQRWTRVAAAALVVFCVGSSAIAQTNAPSITVQPRGGTASPDEDWGFSVVATGSEPLNYRWEFNGGLVPGATNATLEINPVQSGSAGGYRVTVSNSEGSATSDIVNLTVSDTAPRTIRTGTIADSGGIRVPMIFAGNGREQMVSFSLAYDTNVLTNPNWSNQLSNSTPALDLSETALGRVGLSVSLPGQFPATNVTLGEFVFSPGITNDPLAARLQFTNSPTASEAVNTNATTIELRSGVVPQIELVDAVPVLNLQSGLMEQQLTISYAGGLTITNVDIAVGNLTNDSLMNVVTLYNSIGTKSFDTTGYGNLEDLPYAGAGTFEPGITKLLTMEYYVSDKTSAPSPEYLLDLGEEKVFNVPAAATPLDIKIARYLDGTYVIQFDSIANFVYYIQYAATIEDLENNGPTLRLVDPPVTGTGFSMQWIDNGPPKTETPPIDGMRFYRVVELPVN